MNGPISGPVLDKARAAFESTLTDTVTITRPTGTHLDANKTRVTDWTPVWTGAGLVQQSSWQTAVIDKAGLAKIVTTHIAKLPVSADVKPGDRITVTASLDPANQHTWQVGADHSQGWAVLRRMQVDPV